MTSCRDNVIACDLVACREQCRDGGLEEEASLRTSPCISFAALICVLFPRVSLPEEAPVRVDMEIGQLPLQHVGNSAFIGGDEQLRFGLPIDSDGLTTIQPFANDAGKLIIREENGKLHLDSNGDGVVDDKDDPPFVPSEITVTVDCNISGKRMRYPLHICRVKENENKTASAKKWIECCQVAVLKGRYKEGAVSLTEQMPMAQFYTASVLQISGFDRDDPRRTITNLYDFVLVVNGKVQIVEQLPDGPGLKITPYAGRAAELKLKIDKVIPCAGVNLSGYGKFGYVTTEQKGLFVPGTYRVDCISLSNTNKPPNYMSGGLETPLILKEGENTLTLGPPFRMECGFSTNKDGALKITKIDIVGAAGERYRPVVPTADGESLEWFIRAGTDEQSLGKLSYG